jgi:hypothetical protein
MDAKFTVAVAHGYKCKKNTSIGASVPAQKEAANLRLGAGGKGAHSAHIPRICKWVHAVRAGSRHDQNLRNHLNFSKKVSICIRGTVL